MDINKLKEHLQNTPIDQLKKEWEEVKEWGENSPKAEEIVKLFAIPNIVGQSEQLSCDTCKLNCDSWDNEHPCATCCEFDNYQAT